MACPLLVFFCFLLIYSGIISTESCAETIGRGKRITEGSNQLCRFILSAALVHPFTFDALSPWSIPLTPLSRLALTFHLSGSATVGYVLALDLTARNLQAAAKKAGLPWSVAKVCALLHKEYTGSLHRVYRKSTQRQRRYAHRDNGQIR